MNTVCVKFLRNIVLSCRYTFIFLKQMHQQEYETIDESELRDDDVVVEHIHEEAKTEEKENDKGEKGSC